MPRIRRSRRRFASVNHSLYADYGVGQRVATPDGPGVVMGRSDGPFPQTEEYKVKLDQGRGHGVYAVNMLTPLAGDHPVSLGAARSQQDDDDEEVDEDAYSAHPGSAAHESVNDAPHLASEDYPELSEVLYERPPLERDPEFWRYASSTSREVVASSREVPVQVRGSILDRAFEWGAEKLNDASDRRGYPDVHNLPTEGHDWCRFRRDSRCYYPRHLDVAATEQAGYQVWFPEDRGWCPRHSHKRQEDCPVSLPGPYSGDPDAMIDATRSWADGGQRLSIRRAAWSDVRDKATRIRQAGDVTILSVTDNQVVAEVRGDTSTYETSILREPGSKATAMWECTCPWAQYSWGRSGRWKRFEGRQCSHALALLYEIQSREMFGGVLVDDWTDPDDYAVTASREAARSVSFPAKVMGQPVTVVEVDGAADMVLTDSGQTFSGYDVEHPQWDPAIGLIASRRPVRAELRDEVEPALPQTTADDEGEGDDGGEIASEASRAWLLEGNGGGSAEGVISDDDIADAATRFLAKLALKDFSVAEQRELIDEGLEDGVTAANLDRLDLTGTHYLDGDDEHLWD